MLTLRAAIASYPHAVALKDGSVTSDRVRLDFEEMPQITRAFRRMVRTLDFDLCEIALHHAGPGAHPTPNRSPAASRRADARLPPRRAGVPD